MPPYPTTCWSPYTDPPPLAERERCGSPRTAAAWARVWGESVEQAALEFDLTIDAIRREMECR